VADALFVLGLVLPPAVVVLGFALLAVPVRREAGAIRRTDAHAH
jgi:ABC-type molybdate transport system permease subunit